MSQVIGTLQPVQHVRAHADVVRTQQQRQRLRLLSDQEGPLRKKKSCCQEVTEFKSLALIDAAAPPLSLLNFFLRIITLPNLWPPLSPPPLNFNAGDPTRNRKPDPWVLFEEGAFFCALQKRQQKNNSTRHWFRFGPTNSFLGKPHLSNVYNLSLAHPQGKAGRGEEEDDNQSELPARQP